MLSADRRRSDQARLAWKTLNYPIYIPDEVQDVSALLLKGDANELEAELERRASLGSASASAPLGYLEIMGAFSGEPNPQSAITCCTEPARAGDPYAQYVLSRAYWETGNRTDALRWIKRPEAASFLPALVDTGRMLAEIADNAEELRTAVRILWGAHRLGHVVPLVAISGIAFRGRLGAIHRLLGLVLIPASPISWISRRPSSSSWGAP